jgi:hypothetical protein
MLRVTKTKPCVAAIAAICPSAKGGVSPRASRRARCSPTHLAHSYRAVLVDAPWADAAPRSASRGSPHWPCATGARRMGSESTLVSNNTFTPAPPLRLPRYAQGWRAGRWPQTRKKLAPEHHLAKTFQNSSHTFEAGGAGRVLHRATHLEAFGRSSASLRASSLSADTNSATTTSPSQISSPQHPRQPQCHLGRHAAFASHQSLHGGGEGTRLEIHPFDEGEGVRRVVHLQGKPHSTDLPGAAEDQCLRVPGCAVRSGVSCQPGVQVAGPVKSSRASARASSCSSGSAWMRASPRASPRPKISW